MKQKQTKKITAKTKAKAIVAAKTTRKAAKAKIATAKSAKAPAKKTVTTVSAAANAAKTVVIRKEITPEIISTRAYVLWEQAGRPHGRDIEFWVQAETQLKQETQALAA